MADHPEFFNYAEKIQENKMFRDHEEWVHTTFFGKLTHKVLNWAKQSDFFGAVADALSDQSSESTYGRTLSICLTMSIVVVGVVVLYALGSIVQTFIGEEIVVEQKVLIETQVKLSDLMKELESDDENDDDNIKNNNKITATGGERRNKKVKNIKIQ